MKARKALSLAIPHARALLTRTRQLSTEHCVQVPAHAPVHLANKAAELGIRLTSSEMASLARQLDCDSDGIVQRSELEAAGKVKLEEQWSREILLGAIEKPQSFQDRMGTKMLDALDYFGTALFACVGVQIAGGEAGMNLVGCTLVGCVAAMGGGTVNNLLQGNAREGVFWVRNPRYLMVALGASVLTFFAWPVYCKTAAAKELEHSVQCCGVPVTADNRLTRSAFRKFVAANIAFKARACTVLGVDVEPTSADDLFDLVNQDGSDFIELHELSRIVELEFGESDIVYMCDTFSLAALSLVAANGAVCRASHPLVACTAGVTICFGGLLRDVLCGRNLAIGGQSYALATGAGATVFVGLRELALRGMALPLALRLVLSGGAVVGLRSWEKVRGKPLLMPMHAQGKSNV